MKADAFWFFWNLALNVFWVVSITLRCVWFEKWLAQGKSAINQLLWIFFSIVFFLLSLSNVVLNSGLWWP